MGPMEVVSFTFIGAFPFGVQLLAAGAWAKAARGRAEAMTRDAIRVRRMECMGFSVGGSEKNQDVTTASWTMRHCPPSRLQNWRFEVRLERLFER